MDMFIYAIYDYKVESYSNFFIVSHDTHAERMFADVARDKETIIGRNPKDFALVRIGKIDTNTGKVTPEEPAPKFFDTAYHYSTLIGEDESN